MKNKTTFSIHRGLIAFFFGILFCFAPLSGQNVQDTIIAYFNLLEKIPQEKLYLHLDKPFYGAGEKIWFKGYLVNSVTHQDNTQSNFIITELVNRSDSIVERKKKLYEEVLSDKENTIPTENKKIMIAKVRHYKYADILDTYTEFEKLSRTVKIMDTVKLMKKVVPEFKSKNSPRFEVLDKQPE